MLGARDSPLVINKWQLLEPIGTGSFARVYRAQHVDTGEFAAVKAVSTDKVSTAKLNSLRSEISILQTIIHPNIVKLLDYQFRQHDADGRRIPTYYIVLEHCDGGDLAEFLDSCKRSGSHGIDESTARRLLRMLAMGLRELHTHKIVHRDLKPSNILLATTTAAISLKLADFGFARALEPAMMANTLCGSPLYMAPEVLAQEQYDGRADLWSVGVIVYEMVVGQVPFCGNNIIHLKKVVDSNEAIIPYGMRSKLSPACQDLIRSLLHKDPRHRLSFDEFFRHPFLVGNLHACPRDLAPPAPVIVHEPHDASADIEDDYVILSIPGAEDGRPDPRRAAPSHGFQAADESFPGYPRGLPDDMTQEERLFATAQCVFELADWRLVNAYHTAALHLTTAAMCLLDSLLSRLVHARMTRLSSDASVSHLDSCDHALGGFPLSMGSSPMERTPRPQPVGFAGTPGGTAAFPTPPRATAFPGGAAAVAMAASWGCGMRDREREADAAAGTALKQLLMDTDCGGQLHTVWTRLSGAMRHACRLSEMLVERGAGSASEAPALLPLLWEGMVSFAQSAAHDEMFGALKRAAQGYSKAALLGHFIRQQCCELADLMHDSKAEACEACSCDSKPTDEEAAPSPPEARHALSPSECVFQGGLDLGTDGSTHPVDGGFASDSGGVQGRCSQAAVQVHEHADCGMEPGEASPQRGDCVAGKSHMRHPQAELREMAAEQSPRHMDTAELDKGGMGHHGASCSAGSVDNGALLWLLNEHCKNVHLRFAACMAGCC